VKPAIPVKGASARRRLPVLMRVEDAARVLGISRSSAYRAAAAGEIPVVRVAGRMQVPTAHLLRLIGLDGDGRDRSR
jgi:excisionase family DNA binding protein